MDFQSIVKLVQAFDVHGAGSVLDGLYAGLGVRAQQFADTLALQSDPSTYVEPSAWKRAHDVLTDEELGSLCSVLEMARPHEDRGFAGESVVATAYGAAFHRALPELKRALEAAASHLWRHPGWDTTVFGYIAKTCRDREFFSSGAIPAEAIMEARLTDAACHISDTIQNPRYFR
jgi:hypothetical protein